MLLFEAAQQAVESLTGWLGGLSLQEWFLYFWPFFFIDVARYILLDGAVMGWWLARREGRDRDRASARRALFEDGPLVSVVVPGKDEGPHLPALIDSLDHQTYGNLEVVVVDDGSDDDTPAICRRLQREGRIDRFIRHQVRGGKASAANTALYWSRGEFIVHVDADSHLRHDAVERVLLPFYAREDVGAVGGDIRVSNVEESLATRLQAIEYLKAITVGRTSSSEIGILRIVAGAFGAFRRETLQELGGWDVGPGLDGDLTLKIRKLGLGVVHEPEAICYTNAPTSFRALAKQRYRWSRSLVRFRLRKHRDLLNPWSPFRATDFIAAAENVFFTFVLNVKWWAYTAQVLIFHPSLLGFLLPVNWVLYVLSNVVQYLFARVLFADTLRGRVRQLPLFLPLMPLYMGLFLRLVRSFAQLMETVHRASYQDAWNPWKVSRQARREGL